MTKLSYPIPSFHNFIIPVQVTPVQRFTAITEHQQVQHYHFFNTNAGSVEKYNFK